MMTLNCSYAWFLYSIIQAQFNNENKQSFKSKSPLFFGVLHINRLDELSHLIYFKNKFEYLILLYFLFCLSIIERGLTLQ